MCQLTMDQYVPHRAQLACMLLDVELIRCGYSGLDEEDADAFNDSKQWPAMLDDYEARLGLNVSAVREAMTGVQP